MNRLMSVGMLAFASLALVPGCVVGSSSVVEAKGKPISESTLQLLDPGSTSEQQVLDLLGPPTRTMETNDAGTIYVYEYERREAGSGHILFAFSGSSESVEQRTVFIQLRDGVIQRYWVDAT